MVCDSCNVARIDNALRVLVAILSLGALFVEAHLITRTVDTRFALTASDAGARRRDASIVYTPLFLGTVGNPASYTGAIDAL